MPLETDHAETLDNWLAAHNGKHQLHPMQPQFLVQEHPPLIVERGEGVHIFDLAGKRYLDCQGGLWCVNAGHGRREIKDAIIAQLDKLQYYTIFPGSTHAPSIRLSAKLCEVAGDENVRKVFFGSGGSDAVESALKIARQYWKIEGQSQRSSSSPCATAIMGCISAACRPAATMPGRRATSL
jgi:putrescine---pyruvate transaminase